MMFSANFSQKRIKKQNESIMNWESFARRILRPVWRLILPLYFLIIKYTRRLDPGSVTFRDTTGRKCVGESLFIANSRLAVILAIGASNIANEGDPHGMFVPLQGVYNFNFIDGRCYIAKDPLLGATRDRSNLLTRLGDLLVRRGMYDHVLLVPIAYGGTFAAEWAPRGRMHPRLQRALKMLARRRIALTHVFWQEGEAEAAARDADPKTWIAHFNAVVDTIRAAAHDTTIYVAQCTICRNPPNDIIRAAQRNVVDPSRKIFAGPDLDVIGMEDRWDECHFSTAGLDRASELWLTAITEASRHPD
jgi:Carbohydrate esterase, sialic acid-specific acetylesterase